MPLGEQGGQTTGQNSPLIEREYLTAEQGLAIVEQSPPLNEQGSALGEQDQKSSYDVQQSITLAADLQLGPVKTAPYQRLHDKEIEPEGFQDLIKLHYGLHELPVQLSSMLQDNDILSLSEAKQTLGVMDQKEHVPAEMQYSVRLAVSTLKNSQCPPVEICDIAPRSSRHPLVAIDEFLEVVKVDGGYMIDTVAAEKYDMGWKIFLPHASTLFEIGRRGPFKKKGDIVATLLARGLSFRTVREAPALATRITIPPTVKRTFTEPTREFSLEDYLMHEQHRKNLLKQPRGRAALLKGGIVWRLALEVLGEEAATMALTSPEEYKFGVNVGDRYLVDDELTESELDVIVGVYHVATSQRAFANDTDSSIVSWWPRHASWQNSNYNLGHWTWKAELWFRNRRKDILEGSAKPMNQGRWRRALKGNSNTGRVRNAWNAHCEASYDVLRPQQT
ncbi:hypothetical protein EIP86_008172 [Pleurotus ostreatoroseus]|nr:hypothetical protein EIP86_008172 [Pleurotus ostreatoroseus]